MSSTVRNLLVELLVEELPPRSLQKLGDSFAQGLAASLQVQNLIEDGAPVVAFATPRRLAAHFGRVAPRSPDTSTPLRLMPSSIGLDTAAQATPALRKKLSDLGVDAADMPASHLRIMSDGKTEMLYLDRLIPGIPLAAGLQKALDAALAGLPIARTMTYQLADGWSSVDFVRPAHGLVALHGRDVVPVRALGLSAGRETQGHRFEARVSPIVLRDADSYADQLESEGRVIPGFAARRNEIVRQLDAVSAAPGSSPVRDAALLDEVTGLVELPNVLTGKFDDAFLDIPRECLILTMKTNQKYFPLLDAEGRLQPRFLIVSNIRPADPAEVVSGNERVLRARLADARFFFDHDRKKPLDAWRAGLDKVVYHNRLGTQAERVARIAAIAHAIAVELGDEELAAQARVAANLSKADLLTGMVGEFPELQGIMGRYYAWHDGQPDEIAYAIEDHYRPRFAGDALPRGPVGTCVALADKLETLVGMFGIGRIPTGDKDPYALRRHALGIGRILMEKGLRISLETLLGMARTAFAGAVPLDDAACTRLPDFIHERISGLLREQGYSFQQVDAVLASRPGLLNDIRARLEAVRAFTALPEAQSLAAANKRVGNILKKAGDEADATLTVDLLQQPAEHALHDTLNRIAPTVDHLIDLGEFNDALRQLAALREPVDAFFDQVMVNVPDPVLRANRLALLVRLQREMNRVADISRLAT